MFETKASEPWSGRLSTIEMEKRTYFVAHRLADAPLVVRICLTQVAR